MCCCSPLRRGCLLLFNIASVFEGEFHILQLLLLSSKAVPDLLEVGIVPLDLSVIALHRGYYKLTQLFSLTVSSVDGRGSEVLPHEGDLCDREVSLLIHWVTRVELDEQVDMFALGACAPRDILQLQLCEDKLLFELRLDLYSVHYL